jgi:hypothetical protein
MSERKPSVWYWLTAAIIGLLIATCVSLLSTARGRHHAHPGLLRVMEASDFDATSTFGDWRLGLAQVFSFKWTDRSRFEAVRTGTISRVFLGPFTLDLPVPASVLYAVLAVLFTESVFAYWHFVRRRRAG